MKLGVSINDTDGYPCPKDGTVLILLNGGAWCSQCHTVWREVADIPLPDGTRDSRRWRAKVRP